MEEDVEIEQLLKSTELLLHEAIKSSENDFNYVLRPSSSSNLHGGGSKYLKNIDVVRQNSIKIESLKLNEESRISPGSSASENVSINEIDYSGEVQALLDDQIINLACAESENSDDEAYSEDGSNIIKDIYGESTSKHEIPEVVRQLLSVKVLIDKRQNNLLKLEKSLKEELRQNENKQRLLRYECDSFSLTNIKSANDINESRCFFKKFGTPYFKDIDGFAPPINEDHKRKIDRKELHITSLPSTFYWTKTDKLKLIDVIKDIVFQENKQKLVKEIKNLKGELDASPSENREVESRISEKQDELESLKYKTFYDLISGEDPNRDFDWMKISYKFFIDVHSPDECKRYYNLFLKPTENRNFWDPDEDKGLIKLAEEYNYENWDSIAKELGTGRSSYHCFVRYQTQLEGDGRHFQGKWTKEEDKNLTTIVNNSLVGGFIPWSKVSAHLTNRSHNQIYNRWQQSLKPTLLKGRYTPEEDLFIMCGMQIFSSSYTELSHIMKNRTSSQVRDRYERTLLKQSSKVGVWSLDEDQKLLNLVEIHGKSNWALISKLIGNRSRTQVRHRYAIIQRMMRNKEGWNISNAHRKEIVNTQKDIEKLQRRVERMKKQFIAEEKAFKLSKIEKETFRFEKLKKLWSELFEKKGKSQRKKKVLSDQSRVNSYLIEYFKMLPLVSFKYTSCYDSKSVNRYFNEILLMAKFFGVNIKLPKSADDIRRNSRLDIPLKTFLCDCLVHCDETTLNGLTDANNDTEFITVDSIHEGNINYVAPEFDDTILMNEWWHTSPIDVSKLNFSEFFKRTVFDYSYGMHNDIWMAKCRRLQRSSYENWEQENLESNLEMYVPPNSLTFQGYIAMLLSRVRLRHTAVRKDLAHNVSENSHSNIDETQVTVNIHTGELEKFEQTLMLLFTWPKGLSLAKSNVILQRQLENKPKALGKYNPGKNSLTGISSTENLIKLPNNVVGINLQVPQRNDMLCSGKKMILMNKKIIQRSRINIFQECENSDSDNYEPGMSVLKRTHKTYANIRRKRQQLQFNGDNATEGNETEDVRTPNNHASGNFSHNVLSENSNCTNSNIDSVMQENVKYNGSSELIESGVDSVRSIQENSAQIRKRASENEVTVPIKNTKH